MRREPTGGRGELGRKEMTKRVVVRRETPGIHMQGLGEIWGSLNLGGPAWRGKA